MRARESLLAQTFVQLADTLVDDFDVIDVLTLLATRSVELLDAGAGAILLADHTGALRVVAASSEQARLLELFQIQIDEGPCVDCVQTGEPVVNEDLAATARWPRFASSARAAGFVSVQALPLRYRDRTIGAMNVFLDDRVVVNAADVQIAQALADVATIAILHHEAIREAESLAAQLQRALDSRITIEQAKGVLAERADIDMAEAFERLRHHARSTNRKLRDVAEALVVGDLDPGAVEDLLHPTS